MTVAFITAEEGDTVVLSIPEDARPSDMEAVVAAFRKLTEEIGVRFIIITDSIKVVAKGTGQQAFDYLEMRDGRLQPINSD